MSGISGAAEHSINEFEPKCAKCGRISGDIGRHGKKLNCLPLMQGMPIIGVVVWCSQQCYDEWIAVEGRLVPKMIEAMH